MVRVARVYAEPMPADGVRILVDRLWPRGIRKDAALWDEWCKQIAPSTELRTWYGHDPDRFTEFARRYRRELDEPERARALTHLRGLAVDNPVTLLTASKSVDISDAAVLAAVLSEGEGGEGAVGMAPR
jgi:uncharacterized protein YeaO (DUF488 family)